jgi:hypothetical protein
VQITIELQGFSANGFSKVLISQIHSDVLAVDNPPSDPTRFSPVNSSMPLGAGQTKFNFEAQAYSFSVLRLAA